VNGDKAAYIENAITDAKRIAEARAQAHQDHSEAIAERAVNEIDQQISSGVPATPDMWAAWENKIRGTSFADEFKGASTMSAKCRTCCASRSPSNRKKCRSVAQRSTRTVARCARRERCASRPGGEEERAAAAADAAYFQRQSHRHRRARRSM
jgi:hypothetical protein